MATIKQQRAIKILAENGGSFGEAMRKAGYSNVTSESPTKLTKSKGYTELLKKCGLTPKLIAGSLVTDIKKKKHNRKPELELGAKILGMLVDRKDLTTDGEKFSGFVILPLKEDNE